MTPEERTTRLAELDRAKRSATRAARRAVKLESQYWADVRASTPPCAPTEHDVERFLGNTYMVYRCRICGDEEWL